MLRNAIVTALLVCGLAVVSVRYLQSNAQASTTTDSLEASAGISNEGAPACCAASESLTAAVLPNTDDDKSEKTDEEKADAESGKKEKKPKKTYPEPDPEMGHIAGRITLAGAAEDVKLAPFAVDPANRDIGFCKAHVKDERLIVGPKGGVKNVVIALSGYRAPAGTKVRREDFVLDNAGCLFTPHVGATTCGSKLILKNSDPFIHNSRGVLDMAFNTAIPPKGEVVEKVPRKEGFAIVLCDFHPWMQAQIHFFPHEHFDVTEETGTFRLVNIPPGTYTVEIRHEVLCTKFTPVLRKDIVVEKGKTVELDVELEAPKTK